MPNTADLKQGLFISLAMPSNLIEAMARHVLNLRSSKIRTEIAKIFLPESGLLFLFKRLCGTAQERCGIPKSLLSQWGNLKRVYEFHFFQEGSASSC
jgi:hypothetical protein